MMGKRNTKQTIDDMSYCPLSGIVTHTDGTVLGTVGNNNYLYIMMSGKLRTIHRVIFELMGVDIPEGLMIDHIDRNRLNNIWSNLRVVTPTVNARNRSLSCNNTSGVSGVSWHKRDKRWKSRIRIDGKRIELGNFVSYSDAVDARKLAEVAYGYTGG